MGIAIPENVNQNVNQNVIDNRLTSTIVVTTTPQQMPPGATNLTYASMQNPQNPDKGNKLLRQKLVNPKIRKRLN